MKIIPHFVLAATLFACTTDSFAPNKNIDTKDVITKLENLYVSSSLKQVPYEEVKIGVSLVSKEFGVELVPIDKDVYLNDYLNRNSLTPITNSGAKTMGGCGLGSGGIESTEIVDEGGGNWSFVYHYRDGSAYLSSWSGTTRTGGQCYE